MKHGGERPFEPRIGYRINVAELGEHVGKIHATPFGDLAQAKILPALPLGEIDRGVNDPVGVRESQPCRAGKTDPDRVLGVASRATPSLHVCRNADRKTSTKASRMPSTPKAVTLQQRSQVFKGWLRVDRYTLSFEKFDGAMSAPVVREIVDRGHAVAVLPFDPATGKVLLIRQFLAGAYAAGVDPWPLQTIAGMIDTSESAADTALREAEEETGLKIPAGSLRPGPVYLVSPGAFTEIVHVFHVEIDLSDAGGVHGLASESEDIRSEILLLDDALAELRNGSVPPSLTLVALLDLKFHLLSQVA
jgi:ADP-ribose pyrophosphatase